MEQGKKSSTQGERKESTAKYLAALIILLLGCGALTWLVLEKNKDFQAAQQENLEKSKEIDSLENVYTQLLVEYDEMATDNEELSVEVAEQREKIEGYLKKIRAGSYEIGKLKKELTTIRKINKGIYRKLDSVNSVNQMLTAKLDTTELILTEISEDRDRLNSEKEVLDNQVKLGKQLTCRDVSSVGLRISSSGRQKETDRAAKTNMIKTCFTIMENKIAQAGKKKIYLRIISPSGEVLVEGEKESKMMEFDGVMGLYSVYREMDYQNQDLPVCIYWDFGPEGEAPKGNYLVEIYADEVKIGTTNFDLD